MYHYEYTYYIRGQDGQVLAEAEDHDDKFLYRFIYANGQRIVLYDKNNRRNFYLNDHLGSPRVLVDSAGTRRDVYKYYAFGSRSGGSVGSGQAYRYTGKPFDEELDLDLYYYGARYYYPEIGRFPAVDPLQSKYPGWSPYVYCFNNPLTYIDPTGMEGETGEAEKKKKEEEEKRKAEAARNAAEKARRELENQSQQNEDNQSQDENQGSDQNSQSATDKIAEAAVAAAALLVADGPIPVGDVVGVVLITGAILETTSMFAEHRKHKRGSTKDKHEKGRKRRRQKHTDKKRRRHPDWKPNPNKPKP